MIVSRIREVTGKCGKCLDSKCVLKVFFFFWNTQSMPKGNQS
jgi:hypothetical protein